MNEKKLTLSNLKPHKKASVEAIAGGINFQSRLNSMGLYVGCDIVKKSSSTSGPVIVKVCGATVALGNGMAQKITVKVDE
ncbi:MAG TPA: FeoA family protein [Elusimicrobiales bacterium]|nr:FeoA family protein [Elusimicrobiales bacterium]